MPQDWTFKTEEEAKAYLLENPTEWELNFIKAALAEGDSWQAIAQIFYDF